MTKRREAEEIRGKKQEIRSKRRSLIIFEGFVAMCFGFMIEG